jgi:hypothetical protein
MAETLPRCEGAVAPLRNDAAAIEIVLFAEGPPQKRFLALDRRSERCDEVYRNDHSGRDACARDGQTGTHD